MSMPIFSFRNVTTLEGYGTNMLVGLKEKMVKADPKVVAPRVDE